MKMLEMMVGFSIATAFSWPGSLIIGNVVAASAQEDALRAEERDEGDQIYGFPLLAYVNPGRLAEIRQTTAFPFPEGYSR
jgi:hypothetical protein